MMSEPEPRPFPAPVFIAGCMRSGTSLLVDKLTQHPQLLKIGVELNDIWTAIGGANCLAPCEYRTEKDATFEAANNMAAYFAEFMREARHPRRYLMRAKNRYRQGLGRIAYDWEHLIPVNKSPHLTNKLRYVHRLFPQARILFIVRSIEGHSASMKVHFDRDYQRDGLVNILPEDSRGCYTRLTTPPEPAARAYPGDFSIIPEMWIRLNALALQDLQHIDPDRVRVMAYEDLVQRQPEVLRSIFDFLALRSEHATTTERIIHSGMKVINTTTAGDPMQKWRKTLSDSEIAQMEAVIQTHRVG
ncbi:MAG: sulfotransferase, partial [Bacteroidetes bacterium]